LSSGQKQHKFSCEVKIGDIKNVFPLSIIKFKGDFFKNGSKYFHRISRHDSNFFYIKTNFIINLVKKSMTFSTYTMIFRELTCILNFPYLVKVV